MRPFVRMVHTALGGPRCGSVAHVLALAVELGAHAVDDVGDLARDELLHVL